MEGKLYVRSIIRDDDERFDFDSNEVFLSTDNVLLIRPDIDSSEVQYTDIDGGEMIHQRLQTPAQAFNGIIYPKTTDYWTLYLRLTAFFKVNHTYKLVYKRADGTLFAQHGAWMANNIQVPPQPREDYSEWSVGFKLQSASLYEYAEDGSGGEVFANSVDLPLLTASSGGKKWDSVGGVWDSVGGVWEAGNGGVQTVNVASVEPVYPVWTVVGLCINPSLQNNTTDSVAYYDGTVGAGQTLVVDFAAGEARLDGALVTRNIGGIVSFTPGDNIAGFNSDGGTATESTIAWNNIIG